MLVVVGTPHLTGNILAATSVAISSLFYAVFNIQSRQFKHIPALSLLCWSSLISTPHLFLLSYFIDGNPLELIQGITSIAWGSMAYSVAISGIFGITAWIYLLQKYPVHKVLPFNLLVPFFGCSLSILILEEIPCQHIVFGGVITLFGIAITQVKRS
jgi:O-acetylserine/cysteine efflux transporter